MQEPTLTDVLDAVNTGFSEMEKRFVGLETRLDAKIDGVEKRLDAKIDGVEKRLDSLTTAVDGFAGNQLKFEAELAGNMAAHQRFDERLAEIENRA